MLPKLVTHANATFAARPTVGAWPPTYKHCNNMKQKTGNVVAYIKISRYQQ
jgi:hypothetical protein